LVYFPSLLLLHCIHFSPIILTLPQGQQLGHPDTGSHPGIPLATLPVSPPPPRSFGFSSSNLFIFIFTVGLFVFYLFSLILYVSTLIVTLLHMFFQLS
jgi:hypothetical protein